MKIRVLLFAGLAVVALALAGCSQIQSWAGVQATPTPLPVVNQNAAPSGEGRVVREGNIVPRDFVRIHSRTGGKVDAVLVKKGDVVEQNAVLIRLGDREALEAGLAAARLEQLNAQQALEMLNEQAGLAAAQYQAALASATTELIEAQRLRDEINQDTYDKDLDTANTDVAKALDELEDAQADWEKYKDLKEDNATRKEAKRKLDDRQKKYDEMLRKRDLLVNKLDLLDSRLENARQKQADFQRELEKRKNGAVSARDLALAQARLENAKAQVTAAQAALDNLEIRAPIGGVVVELDLAPGEMLLPNQQAALVADLDALYIETNDLNEMDVVKISEGQEATVEPDAISGLTLPATVTEIARSAGKKGGDVTYLVRLKLDQSDPRLRWGMTVEVHFR